ncbi:MAG: hypothetical protein ACU843_05020 [Gammaproteobacteria bacterium]
MCESDAIPFPGGNKFPVVFKRQCPPFTAQFLFLAVSLSGCVTDSQFLAENSASALHVVESRGKFDLNCAEVTTSVLSRKVIQGIQTNAYGWRGASGWAGPWTEYTVGIRGCGRQAVYMAVCRDPDSCNAFSQTGPALNTPQ